MDALELMKGFADKLRAAEKELTRLEKRAKTLSEKHDVAEAERASLEDQIQAAQEAITAAQDDREGLLEEWTRASFEGDTQAQREVRGRKAELDQSIEDKQAELQGLRDRLEGLDDLSREIAEIYVAVEALSIGDAWLFATRLRTELVNNEVRLKSRQSEASKMLPRVDLDVLEAVRADADEEYLEKKQRREEELEAARQYRIRNEQNLQQKAQTQYIGAGQGGKRRAATIGEATRKIRETRQGQ
jgi:hypothetical protein